MTANTTTVALHPVPAASTVMLDQIRTVGLALRKPRFVFLGFLGVLILITVLRVTGVIQESVSAPQVHMTQPTTISATTIATPGHAKKPEKITIVSGTLSMGDTGARKSPPARNAAAPRVLFSIHVGYWPPGTLVTMLIGFFVPFGVWRSEEPSRRTYHWTMPVPHALHTIFKVVAGWLWLMAATVAYIGLLAAQKAVLAHTVGGVDDTQLLAWQWAIPFAAVTLVYLLSSAVVIATDHPWRWIGGGAVAYGVALGFLSTPGLTGIRQGLIDLWLGQYGLYAVFCGISFHHLVDVMMRTVGHLPPPSRADFLLWLKAATLWLVVGVVVIGAAAYRRPQQ